ncbi:Hypothetical predicted protein, partial [Pelobates cultripes]
NVKNGRRTARVNGDRGSKKMAAAISRVRTSEGRKPFGSRGEREIQDGRRAHRGPLEAYSKDQKPGKTRQKCRAEKNWVKE